LLTAKFAAFASSLAESPTLEDAAETLGINVSTLWCKRKRYKID
jgi:hypothetical protein